MRRFLIHGLLSWKSRWPRAQAVRGAVAISGRWSCMIGVRALQRPVCFYGQFKVPGLGKKVYGFVAVVLAAIGSSIGLNTNEMGQ
jgi:hypothetical protein